jgi:O-antigen/teichoic acid export membrane protein
VLIITYALLALTALPYYVSLGIGRPRILAVFNVITATINVVLIFILIPAYGLIGAAFAYLAATVTVPFLIIYLERRVLALERSPWPSLILRLGLVALAQAACCLLLRPLATGLAQVIILLFVGVAIGPALALLTGYLRPEDRATLLRLMRIRKRSIRRRTADSTVD